MLTEDVPRSQSGCVGYEQAGLPNGTFYNNNIGECTAKQVIESDSREFVTGTFVWSGFDCEFFAIHERVIALPVAVPDAHDCYVLQTTVKRAASRRIRSVVVQCQTSLVFKRKPHTGTNPRVSALLNAN